MFTFADCGQPCKDALHEIKKRGAPFTEFVVDANNKDSLNFGWRWVEAPFLMGGSIYSTIILWDEIVAPNTLRLYIEDTGEGINEINITQLFMPFSRIKEHKHIEGAGIGLSISKHL